MTTWTNSAQKRLSHYFNEIRPGLADSGADPDEVIDDIRSHLDREIEASSVETVTESDVTNFLARIGAPAPVERDVPAKPAAGPSLEQKKPWYPMVLFLGVILPVIALGVEVFSRMSAGLYVDPIPGFWNVLLILLVPLANALAVWELRSGSAGRRPGVALFNGVAIGISLFYSVVYAPLLPFALIGVVYFGIGMLPLSPLLSLVAACRLRYLLRWRVAPRTRLGGLWPGLGLAAVLMFLIAFPPTATRILTGMAVSESPSSRATGVRLLRSFGHEKTLLSDCYGRSGRGELSPFRRLTPRITPEQARSTYFRVTGKAFNTVPPPQLNFSRGGWDIFDDFDWDSEQGGTVVAGRLKGLWVTQSRMDGLIETDPALGYTEWTLEFRNDWTSAREARAQIALPPGGVVSRLTLWVNGEEREAAFAGRSQVRKAYQEVAIRQRRDPVLVTSCGPDRVLMQCFPVPPNGGRMKIRLGITAPLVLKDLGEGVLPWPHFLERNFGMAEDFEHAIWVQSGRPLSSAAGTLSAIGSGSGAAHSLQGQLSDRELGDPVTALHARRSESSSSSWVADSDSGSVIHQRITREPDPAVSRVVVVVDDSAEMAGFLPRIAESLGGIPAGVEWSLLLASDEVIEVSGDPKVMTPGEREKVVDFLARRRPRGGQDNLPALLRAWSLAARSTNGVVVWIHGPQPFALQSAEALVQKLQWQSRNPILYDLQTAPGPNRVAEELDGLQPFRAFPRTGTVREDLERLFAGFDGETPASRFVREEVSRDRVPAGSVESSRHLGRLWALEEVVRLKAARKIEDAVRLAATYQLVTMVSGAVVLETREQFDAHQLTPVDADSVPSVPEPAHLVLILMAGMLLLVVRRRRVVRD